MKKDGRLQQLRTATTVVAVVVVDGAGPLEQQRLEPVEPRGVPQQPQRVAVVVVAAVD